MANHAIAASAYASLLIEAASECFDAFVGATAAMSARGRGVGKQWWAKPLSFIPLNKQCLTFLAAYQLSAVNGIGYVPIGGFDERGEVPIGSILRAPAGVDLSHHAFDIGINHTIAEVSHAKDFSFLIGASDPVRHVPRIEANRITLCDQDCRPCAFNPAKLFLNGGYVRWFTECFDVTGRHPLPAEEAVEGVEVIVLK
jgi:hypothetical protein